MADPAKNFAKCVVSGGYSAADTSIILQTGEGAKLPAPVSDGAFNLVWWNYTDYPDPSGDPNREIVRCTARTSDTLTVTRAQESTSASTKNTSGKVYMMALSFTKKTYDDFIAAIDLALLKSGGTMTGMITLATGTTSLAPIKFVSGTNLTTPVAGVIEFDGTDLYISV